VVDGPRVLVVGASGYIGGRLVDKLVAEGIRPVLVGRDPAALTGRWPGLEARRLDLDRPDSIEPALAGIEVAFYLVRLWDGSRSGMRRDATRVEAFSAAAARAGVRRVIHLTSLWDPFSACDAPGPAAGDGAPGGPALAITELRAGLIIGSGSSNFEILRYLVERQPVLVVPRWARTRLEPVSTGDISPALVAALRHPEVTGRVELGCGEVVDFAELCRRYARSRGLRRPIIPVPVWGKRASALWIHLLSPVPAALALPFVRSLGRESTVRDPQPAARLGIVTRRVDEMLRRAIERRDTAATTWFDAVRRPRAPLSDQNDIEGMYRDQREQVVDAPPEAVFAAVTRIGGDAGWPSAEFLWDVRGIMDRAVGGPGMRRGRRDPVDLRVGDVVDFWRVEACEVPEILRLCAEMKLPGLAWLQFEMTPVDGGRTRFVQTAYFEPRGVLGFLYWWSVLPFHVFVFGSMLRELARRAELLARTGPGAVEEPAATKPASPA
jgi:uncharacterized protein YbjT (DUF2867 family)